MKRSFSSLGQYSVVEADIDEAQLSGHGDRLAPRLIIPFQLNVSHGYMKPEEGIKFRQLRVKLCSAPTRVVIAEAFVDLNQLIVKSYHAIKIYANPEFPLDMARLHMLESARAGGNLKLRLEARLFVDHLWSLNPQAPAQQALWGYFETWEAQLDEELTIPRDTWVSNVLPRVGYGTIQILELPVVPLESFQDLHHSFEALRQAQERQKIGLYDDAVAKCRVALDPFFELVEKADEKGVVRRVPELQRSWQSKLGEATYRWLNDTFGAVREAANPTHHSPNSHYDQMESQMIFGITAAVLAYVARTQKQLNQTAE